MDRTRGTALPRSHWLTALLVSCLSAFASADEPRVFFVEGSGVTGSNRLMSKPIWDLGEELGTEGGFNFVFAHNPGFDMPSPITEFTPLDTPLASGVSEKYLNFFGLTIDDIDPALINVPLRELPIQFTPALDAMPLQSIFDLPPDAPGLGEPAEPITVGQWIRQRARATIMCYDNGRSNVRIVIRRGVPNGIYSIWGVFGFDTDGSGQSDVVGGVPLGGVPNLAVANEDGRAVIRRPLQFCPFDEPRLKYFTIAFHSNHTTNGAVPDRALRGQPGGTTAQPAISIPINVLGPAQ